MKQTKRRYVQWISKEGLSGVGDNPEKIPLSCPNDRVKLTWEPDFNRYICVRCGHIVERNQTHYQTPLQRTMSTSDSGDLHIIGKTSSYLPSIAQPRNMGRVGNEWFMRKHRDELSNPDDDELRTRKGFTITSSQTFKSTKDVINPQG